MKKWKKMLASILTICTVVNLTGVTILAEETDDKTSDIQVVADGGKNYYLADGENAGPDNFDVWTRKTIEGTENEDEFEVTLQVGTTVKAIPNDVAVVLVMDTSGSMLKDANGHTWGRYGELPSDGTKLRIDYAKEAAQEFAEQLAKSSDGSRRMLSVVEFGNNAMTVLPWTNVNDKGSLNETVSNAISSVNVNFVYDNRNFWDEEWIEQADIMLNIPGGGTQELKVENWSDEEYIHETKNYCEVSAGEASDNIYCTFEGCAETVEHMHCTYSICSNPEGHKHCERVGRCDVNHEHCKDIKDICGEVIDETNADTHKHVRGCTVYGCQDTTKNHRHGCTNGALWKDYSGYNEYVYTFYDMTYGSENANARCLNSDPNHTHDVYDCDSYYNGMFLDRIHQAWYYCCTNMEGGLMLARNLVKTGLNDGGAIEGIDDVYVVLLSDGGPTYHVNQSLIENEETEVEFFYGERGGSKIAVWEDVEDIVEDSQSEGDADISIVDEIKEQAEFYSILYGTVMNDKLGGDHVLSELTAEEWFTGTGTNYINADAVFASSEIDELNTVFTEIKNRIDVMAKAWTVNDILNDDVIFEEFTKNGDHASIVPVSSDTQKTVSWNLGAMEPESGTGSMKDPYIYTLKYRVTLNSAKDNVKETSLAYDAGTSKEAVWTSVNTDLQYFMIEKDQLDTMTPEEIAEKMRSASFENTSVKGLYGDFEFVKKNGATGALIEGAGFTLYNAEGQAYGAEVFSDAEGKVVFTGIPRGEYTLKETTVPAGMMQMAEMGIRESWGEATGGNGKSLPAVIENDPIAGTLIINKTLDTFNKTIGGATFVFQVEATMTNVETGIKENVYSDVVSITFTEPGTDRVVVTGIPAGAEVTVTEVYSGASYKLTSEAVQTAVIADETATEPASVAFSNTYNGKLNGGNGIVNKFMFDTVNNGWIHKATLDSTL